MNLDKLNADVLNASTTEAAIRLLVAAGVDPGKAEQWARIERGDSDGDHERLTTDVTPPEKP